MSSRRDRRRVVGLARALLALVLLVGSAMVVVSPAGAVLGSDDVTFVIAIDGAPLLGATVALVGPAGLAAHGTTDAQGHVTFTDIPEGGYEIWASAPGWDLGDGTTRWLVYPGFPQVTDTALPAELTNALWGRRLSIPHAIAVDAVPIDLRWLADVPAEHVWFKEVRAVVNAGIARGPLFRPTSAVSRQAIAAWLARRDGVALEVCSEAPFPDVPVDHPFCPEIDWLVSSGATEGYADGTFRPTAAVTRQSAAAFLWRLAGEPPVAVAPPTFSDVGDDHPFRTAIEWMTASGRSTGWDDGTFRPDLDVSRQAMARFLYPDVRPGALDPGDVPLP